MTTAEAKQPQRKSKMAIKKAFQPLHTALTALAPKRAEPAEAEEPEEA